VPLGFLTGLPGIKAGGVALAENPMRFLEVLVFLDILIVI